MKIFSIIGTSLVLFLCFCTVSCDLPGGSQGDDQGEIDPEFVLTVSEGTYSNAIELSWTAMNYAGFYQYTVWASESADGSGAYRYKKTNLTEAYFFADPGDDSVYFCIKANNEDDDILGRTEWKTGFAGSEGTEKSIPPITGFEVSQGEYDDRIVLSWDESPEAHYYALSQTTTLDLLPGRELNSASETAVTLNITESYIYYFIVMAETNTRVLSDYGEICSGYISGGNTAALSPPGGITIVPANESDDATVSWEPVTGADAYRVYLSASPEINYFYDPSTGQTDTTSVNVNVEDGENLYARIMSVHSNGDGFGVYSDLSGWYRLSDGAEYSQGLDLILPEAPGNFSAAARMTSIICSWEPVETADRYGLFMQKDLSLELVGYAQASPYTIYSCRPETTYTLKIRAYGEEGAGDFAESLQVETLPLSDDVPAPSDVEVQASETARAAIFDWTEVDGAGEYGLYRSEDGETFTLITQIQVGSTLTNGSHGYLDDNDLEAHKTYYYYMTTYDTEGDESEPGDIVTVTIGDN